MAFDGNIITKILEKAKSEIIANMSAKGVNASGRTSRAFFVRSTSSGYQLVKGKGETKSIDTPRGTFMTSVAPLNTLERGREGGRVPQGFYYIIRNWTIEKGLMFNTDRERGTFAYFVAQKIAREGTERNKRNIDVYTTPAKTAAQQIRGAFNDLLSATVRATLHKSIK